MDAIKHKLITETELFSILESSESELGLASPRLDELAAQIFDGGMYEPGTYARLVKEGFFSAATVKDRNGDPKFVVIYSRSKLGWLYVEAIASLQRSSLKLMFSAVDELARHCGCKVIQFVTKLSGMFKFSQGEGYKPVGVILLKNALPA